MTDDPGDEIAGLLERERTRLAAAGTWFTGDERVTIASAARGEAPADGPTTVMRAAATAARRIYDRPATITRPWLAGLERDGLTLEQYVEVLGIVARLRAVDTLLFGLGRPARPVPAPLAGTPSRTVVEARIDGGWVPTVGPAWPPTALSAVPAENEAMHDLHGVLYLTPDAQADGFSMGNLSVVRDGLTRSQMEFVAARTSLLNDCFF